MAVFNATGPFARIPFSDGPIENVYRANHRDPPPPPS